MVRAKHITVLVSRDMAEKIPLTCFEHEVKILKAVHGSGAITKVDAGVDSEIDINPEEEFDRLVRVYGKDQDGNIYAERAYTDTEKFAELFDRTKAKAGTKAKAEGESQQ